MIVSKFRKMFFYKFIFIHSICFIVFIACFLGYIYALESKTKDTCVVIGIFDLFIWIGAFLELARVSKIRILEDSIENIMFLSRKKTILQIKDIEKIEKQRVRTTIEGADITDGYYESAVSFKNFDSILVISPDCYSNYDEIMLEIKSKIGNQHFV